VTAHAFFVNAERATHVESAHRKEEDTFMADTPESAEVRGGDVSEQLQRTFADLQALGESVGALPAGSAPRVASRRELITTSVIVLVGAVALSWFVWDHWHSVFAAIAPLVWIVGHSLRWRRRSGNSALGMLSARIGQATEAGTSSAGDPPASGPPPEEY
jgi:hypothetical protein